MKSYNNASNDKIVNAFTAKKNILGCVYFEVDFCTSSVVFIS